MQARVAHLREVERLNSQIASLRKRGKARIAWEQPTTDTLLQAVREYRVGGTSIRKVSAKYGIERGYLHRAIQEADKAMPTVDRPGKFKARTKAQIDQGHREFLARLAEEE